MHRKVLKHLVTLHETVRLYHWTSKAYSKHVASDNMYASLQKLTDNYIETFFGRFGMPKKNDLKKPLDIQVKRMKDNELSKYLRKVCANFEHGVLGKLSDTDSGLNAVRDEIVMTLRKNIYVLAMK